MLPIPILLRPSSIWEMLVRVYSLAMFFFVLMSWIPDMGPLEVLRKALAVVCEPYIGLFRRILPAALVGSTGLDFSPMVAWAVLTFIIGPVVSVILRLVGL